MNEANDKKLYTILAVVLFILGAAVRLYDLTDEPLETHPARQFRAAIIARAFYYENNPEIPAEKAAFAERQLETTGLIEPSILEWLTAQSYKLAGQEAAWQGRIFTTAFWLLGGVGLYLLALELGSPIGALLALSYYLFLPFGVRLSRALMPDPIMIGLTVLAVWALYTWQQRRSLKWALAAGLLTGAAILVKTVAGIILLVPFALYLLASIPIKKALTDKLLWLILVLAALPTSAYYIWGVYIDGRLATQFGGRFFPSLWTDLVVYKSWGLRIIQEFSLKAFLVGLAGIVLAARVTGRKADSLLLFGWWAGYFIYGMLFIYYTWTHDYYHLPMVPLLALSLSPTVAAFEDFAKKKNFARLATAGLAAAVLYVTISGAVQSVRFLNQADYRQTRQQVEELGEYLKTAPSGTVLALTNDYETSYRFYTFSGAEHWPASGEQRFKQLQGNPTDQFEKLWEEKTAGAGYFLVMDFKELNRQPNLVEKLDTLPVVRQTDLYTLYDLQP
jgi:hypothetical protein